MYMGRVKIFYEGIRPVRWNGFKAGILVDEVVGGESFVCGEVNIILCSDDLLIDINRRFLKHDYYTDIITFDYSEGGKISGDLYISVERIRENAETYSVSFSEELMRVIIHGVLHLTGYDDRTAEEKSGMTRRENHYMAKYRK